MTNPSRNYKDRSILEGDEVAEMISKADEIDNLFFRLRVKAVIAIAKIFGKRRSEIASLRMQDLQVKDGFLYVTFTIRKKHKRGLFQYIKFLQKKDPGALEFKQYAELLSEWREWTKTKEGYRIKEETAIKKTPVNSQYCAMILEYYEYMKANHPEAKYLFPSGVCIFGENYIVDGDRHLSGRQLLRLIKPLNPAAWLHLFRETKGAEIAREGGRNLNTLYEVRDTLDLENEETAYRYIRRYAIQEVRTDG